MTHTPEGSGERHVRHASIALDRELCTSCIICVVEMCSIGAMPKSTCSSVSASASLAYSGVPTAKG